MASAQMERLKAIAANAKAGPCIDCAFFRPDPFFQRFRWFGLRRDVETPQSLRYGQCDAHLIYASVARGHVCKGRNFQERKGE